MEIIFDNKIAFLEILFLVIILVFSYSFFVRNFNSIISSKKLEFKTIFIKNTFELSISFSMLFIFIFYFVFYIRFFRILIISEKSINIYFCFKQILFFFELIDSNLILILILIFIFKFMVFFYLFFYFSFFFFKLVFFKLHYYLFFRSKNYTLILRNLNYVEIFIYDNVTKVNVFNYIFFFGVHLLFFSYLGFCLIFCDGSFSLKFFYYYAVYIFFFRIYSFITTKLNYDFDLVLSSFYYPDIDFRFIATNQSLIEYQKLLLFGVSKYCFVDSIYRDFPWKIKSNWLIVDTFKYSLNCEPNDFHTKINLIRPKYFKS